MLAVHQRRSTVVTYGPVDVNGVWLEPSPATREIIVSTENGDTSGDGTVIEAEGSDTTYGVWVPNDSTDETNTLGTGPIRNGPIPEASAPLILVGQVNLGHDFGTPWVYGAYDAAARRHRRVTRPRRRSRMAVRRSAEAASPTADCRKPDSRS